jgi:hypothetical protein
MPSHSNVNQSKQQANLPIEQRPRGNEGEGSDATSNPPGERREERGQAKEQQQQGRGQPSPGLKDKEAETSNSYGDTRESGESLKR